jgi:hypothetical protein
MLNASALAAEPSPPSLSTHRCNPEVAHVVDLDEPGNNRALNHPVPFGRKTAAHRLWQPQDRKVASEMILG